MYNLLLRHNLLLYLICLFYKEYCKGPAAFSLRRSPKRHGQCWACKHLLWQSAPAVTAGKTFPRSFSSFPPTSVHSFCLSFSERLGWGITPDPNLVKSEPRKRSVHQWLICHWKKKKKKSLSSKGNHLDEQKKPSGWKLFLAEALWSPRRATAYPSWDTRDGGLPARYSQRGIIPHTKVPAYFLPLWATEAVRAKRFLKALIIMLSTRSFLYLGYASGFT